jgi:TRAP-type C4-dicarboxylate transport system substrate-binding protein
MKICSLSNMLMGALFAFCLLPEAATASRVLTYYDHEPLAGMRTRFIHDVLFPAIEKESAGRLKIRASWGGKYANGYKALALVGKSTSTDMATVVPEYAADALPLHQIFKSFPVGPSGQRQVDFFRKASADIPDFNHELSRANVVNLFSATGYPVAFFAANPLNSVQNIQGNWRSASFWHHDFLRYAGANPVTIPWGNEVYTALRAKTLDGLMVNIDSGYMLKVHEVAPHILAAKELWLGHVYLLVMNKKSWEKLPQEDKEAIARATNQAYQQLGAVMDRSFDQQVAELKQAGASVQILNHQQLELWKKKTHYLEEQNDWVRAQEVKGVANVRPVMQAVTELMNQPSSD